MTQIEQLASCVVNSSYDDLSAAAVQALKGHILDALGCAVGALDAEVMRLLAAQLDEFGGASLSTLIGGGRTAPDRAALFNSALVRYLDFNDSYLAP
jgi:2-methylcitrate dehydratase